MGSESGFKNLKLEYPKINFELFDLDLNNEFKNFIPGFINPNLVEFENQKIKKETLIN